MDDRERRAREIFDRIVLRGGEVPLKAMLAFSDSERAEDQQRISELEAIRDELTTLTANHDHERRLLQDQALEQKRRLEEIGRIADAWDKNNFVVRERSCAYQIRKVLASDGTEPASAPARGQERR